ncbi:MAG: hypothetical protein LBU27_08200 [Candidatus Peribacteria bacterium]|jgi:hypothetical protein|nr:hypothetical protein [Candidatus Peribacteria bacterium]
MVTANSLRNHYENVKSKINSLPKELKDIISADLTASLNTDFSALSPSEMEELKNNLSALIEHSDLSDQEREKFQTLQLEIFTRYPQKLELLPEHGDLLISRDNLARLLAANRFNNGVTQINKGVPAGEIELQPGVKIEISNVKDYDKLKNAYEAAIHSTDLGKQKQLDTQLAERLILECKKWIQIDNEQLNPGNQDYKDFGELIKNAEKALRDLRKIGYDVEYVRLGGTNRLQEEYLKEIEQKLANAKARSATEYIAKVRQWAYQQLLSDEMTPEKLQALIDLYQQKVDQESAYDVGNHEPLTIFKDARGQF